MGSTVYASMNSGESASFGVKETRTQFRSWTTINEGPIMPSMKSPPIHPGEVLLTEFLQPMQLSQYALAKAIGVPARRINEIVLGRRSITPDTALRLSRYFGLSERFWLNLQTRYDLEMAKDRLDERLEQEVSIRTPIAA